MNVIGSLRALNRRLGKPARFLGPIREVIEPRLRMRRFERDRKARIEKYKDAQFTFAPRPEVTRRLEDDGCAIIPQAINPSLLVRIREEVEAHLDASTCLLPIAKDSVRREGDRGVPIVYLTAEEEARGQGYLRQHTNYVSIANPLLACPSTVLAAFHPLLIDIAWDYLGCVPAIGGLNLRKSYVNLLPEFDTLYFHVDPNSPRFLKFFIYLNDVDIEGGPFCYVRQSHRKRFPGWKRRVRWTYEELAAAYDPKQIVPVTARLGDLVVADTNGFHRGLKPLSTDRLMLTIDYGVHEELEGALEQSAPGLSRRAYEHLTAREKAIAEFLEIR